MNNPDFEVVEHRIGLPNRPRRIFSSFHFFGKSKQQVLVDPDIAHSLRRAAADAQPRETGGLLVGRSFSDRDGDYVTVLGFVEAPISSGRIASISVSPESTAKLRQLAAEQYPSMDVVGWWHSHSLPSDYSATDRNNQQLWTDPMHVGLLVFAKITKNAPWASVYLGPMSLRLAEVTKAQKQADGTEIADEDVDQPLAASAMGSPVADPAWAPPAILPGIRNQKIALWACVGLLLVGMMTLMIFLANVVWRLADPTPTIRDSVSVTPTTVIPPQPPPPQPAQPLLSPQPGQTRGP